MRKLKLKELALSENLVSLLGKQRAYWGKYPSRYIVKNALNLDLVYYVLKHLHGLGQCCQGRREGGGAGGGGELPRAPRCWGPLEIFCWAPVFFAC
jgi:hypothetical protein